MPGLDGLETAGLIKGRARTRDVPIVFLTAAQDEVEDIIRGYGVGAVDYVLKPFDAELLRSKVAVFAELESSRRALKRSEAFLRGAFDAAPIGKTVLDGEQRIVRSNPAFARMLGRTPAELEGVAIAELCHPEDESALLEALAHAAGSGAQTDAAAVDLRLRDSSGSDLWVGLEASSIEPSELAEPLLLVQWVDLSVRRRAEEARADLLLEQAARAQAEAMAERLDKLQRLASATESLSLDELLPALALGLAELFGAGIAEVHFGREPDEPAVVRAAAGRVIADERDRPGAEDWKVAPLLIEGVRVGELRLGLPQRRRFTAAERSLLTEASERASLSIRRAELHEHEHRIAVELQRGLLPQRLPDVDGIELAAHYQAGGAGAEVGGDWYDAFSLPDGRLGVVVGDVAGRGIPAASAMGQLRSVTRAFALADDQERTPGEVLTSLNRHQLALGSDELFTVIYAIIDPRERAVSWANAGHPAPIMRIGAGETRHLEGGDGLMGIKETEYEDRRAPMPEGATLVLFTDGLIERRGEALDTGLDRLAAVVESGPESPDDLCEHILARLLSADRELRDDVTAVVAKVD
jgi:PAS domain S-box-containing protein